MKNVFLCSFGICYGHMVYFMVIWQLCGNFVVPRLNVARQNVAGIIQVTKCRPRQNVDRDKMSTATKCRPRQNVANVANVAAIFLQFFAIFLQFFAILFLC
jgi:hypothetical protein